MDTPPVSGMSGSTPDNYLKVLLPTPSVNIAGDSASMADVRLDEHAIGPAVVTGASTTHISPINLMTHGDVSRNTGLTSQLHNLRILMLDDIPEQILINIEVRLSFPSTSFGQFLIQMRNVDYSALAQTFIDGRDHNSL